MSIVVQKANTGGEGERERESFLFSSSRPVEQVDRRTEQARQEVRPHGNEEHDGHGEQDAGDGHPGERIDEGNTGDFVFAFFFF